MIGNESILAEKIQNDQIEQWKIEGSTIIYVNINGNLKVVLAIQDKLRDEASQTVS